MLSEFVLYRLVTILSLYFICLPSEINLKFCTVAVYSVWLNHLTALLFCFLIFFFYSSSLSFFYFVIEIVWSSAKLNAVHPYSFVRHLCPLFLFLDLYIYLFFPSLMKEWYELQNLIFKTMVEMKRSFLCFLNCRNFNGSSYYARDLGVRCQFQSIMESSVLLKIECFCEFIGVQNLLYLFCTSKLWEHIVCEFLIHLCMNKLLN